MDKFSQETCKSLKHYVYRLIDPRNGQTFYVGTGKDNRVFDHVKDQLKLQGNEDELSEKLETIRKIRQAGLEVVHIIHRHGMDQDTALEVEATLIDATPELTNVASGRGSNERGPAHVKEVEEKYSLQVMTFISGQRLLIIKVRQQTVDDRGSLYHAVRKSWILAKTKAEKAEYVLAVVEGVCRGVFVAERWKKCEGTKKRYEFNGYQVGDQDNIAKRYVGRLIPGELRKPGMAAPCLYVGF